MLLPTKMYMHNTPALLKNVETMWIILLSLSPCTQYLKLTDRWQGNLSHMEWSSKITVSLVIMIVIRNNKWLIHD